MLSQGGNEEQARIITTCLIILTTIALAGALLYTRSVMIPFVLALFVTYMVSPLVDILQLRFRVPRIISISIAMLIIFIVTYTIASLIVYSIQSVLQDQALYQNRLLAMIEQFSEWLNSFDIDIKQEEIFVHIRDWIRNLPVTSWLRYLAGQAMNVITKGGLVLIFAVFLLLGRNPHRIHTGLYAEIDAKVRRYLLTKTAISALTAILVGLVFWLMELDLALVFAVLTFFLNFIPSLGSIVATLLPLPVAFIQYESILPVILILALPGAIQLFIGNFVDPKILGYSLNLHPVAVILSLVFWGLLWGPVGMVLAAPIMAVLRIVLARIETTRPIADLMIGRLPESNDDVNDGEEEATQKSSSDDEGN